MYRLLADILNDFAFVLDCLSPAFPKSVRVLVLSFSSVLRALCGVAAGSAKASLSAHFARWGNLGELNAKDSSQETVISLMGMLAGSLVVQWITSPMATWTTLILLLSVHLEMNRRAVRAVSMRSLNRQRANLVYHALQRGHVPSPEEVSSQERIFERPGVLRAAEDRVLGYCTFGASLSSYFKTISTPHGSTGSTKLPSSALQKLLQPFSDKNYIMWYDPVSLSKQIHVHVALKQHASQADQLAAWWHALALAEASVRGHATDDDKSLLERTLDDVSVLMAKNAKGLEDAGWDLSTAALETGSNTRLAVRSADT